MPAAVNNRIGGIAAAAAQGNGFAVEVDRLVIDAGIDGDFIAIDGQINSFLNPISSFLNCRCPLKLP